MKGNNYQMIEKDINTKIINEKERFIVEDRDSGSRGVMPIVVDEGYEVEIVKVDKGILNNQQVSERACDYMLISKKESEKLVCMNEIKGTANAKEITHAYNQISQSIDRLSQKYLRDSDYIIATIVGAQDKTIPRMIGREKRNLCKKMFSKSKIKVKDMDNLVIYIQPNKRIEKAYVNKHKMPRVIECHTRNEANIPFTSMLLEAVKN